MKRHIIIRTKNQATPLFHDRYRTLLLIGAIGGIYHPALKHLFPSRAKQWALRAYTTVTCIFLAGLPLLNLVHFLFMAQNLYDQIMDLMIMSSGLHAIARIAWFIMRAQQFGNLHSLWDEYFGTDEDTADRERHIRLHYSVVQKRMRILVFVGSMALNPWMILQFFEAEKEMKIPCPIPYRRESPDYEILVTAYVFTCLVHTFACAAIHTLMLLPVLWVLGELERLKSSLKSIVKIRKGTEDFKRPSRREMIDIDRRLGVWVRQHQKVVQFFEKSAKLLWVPYSIEMLATFMAAWLIAFNYVQDAVNVEDKISEWFFYMPYVLMFSLTCYYCDRVKDESGRILDEAYAENWSALPSKYRASLVIVATQTQRPFIVKGFAIFPTGYFTFAQIMQSAYTVLNFLLAATRNE